MAIGKVASTFDRWVHGIAEDIMVRAFVARGGGGVCTGAATACYIWPVMLTTSNKVLMGVRI
jgi:hypothetical protein